MRFSAALVALAAAVVVFAVDIPVTVGDGGSLAFNPTSVTAAVGDTISFQFRAKNHTVTQSTFASPCTIMTSPEQGIDSGFLPVAAGATEFPSWSFSISNATTPLWFYCKQKSPANHCQAGMVFAINPTADKSFDAFQAAAKASGSSTTGSGGYGSGSGTTTTSGGSSTSTAATGNGAIKMSGSAVSILVVAGLVAGLVL